jgi:hypothetical protein
MNFNEWISIYVCLILLLSFRVQDLSISNRIHFVYYNFELFDHKMNDPFPTS